MMSEKQLQNFNECWEEFKKKDYIPNLVEYATHQEQKRQNRNKVKELLKSKHK